MTRSGRRWQVWSAAGAGSASGRRRHTQVYFLPDVKGLCESVTSVARDVVMEIGLLTPAQDTKMCVLVHKCVYVESIIRDLDIYTFRKTTILVYY